MDIKSYDCPDCGGTVGFDIETQKMKCPSCGTVFERDVFEESESGEEGFFKCSAEVWENLEDDDLASGGCPSCGAELYGGKTAIAMVCPCCGNAQIVAKRVSGILKPDCVIPFKLNKNAAVAALSKFYEGKRLLPDLFTSKNRLTALQGVYAPFWLFDALVNGDIEYHATKETGGKHRRTIHYTVLRKGYMIFKRVPVDASVKMDDEYMDAIEPFNYRQLEKFHPSYLAGYVAEKYDVDVNDCKKRAMTRIIETMDQAFEASAQGYTKLEVTKRDVKVKDGKAGYGLFPVWTLNTKYDGDNYLFMMNGQTGKLVGRLPVDEGKALRYMTLLTGGFFPVVVAFMYLFFTAEITERVSWALSNYRNGDASVVGIAKLVYFIASADVNVMLPIIAIISFVIAFFIGRAVVGKWRRQMDTVEERETAFDYAQFGGAVFTVKKDIKDKAFRLW